MQNMTTLEQWRAGKGSCCLEAMEPKALLRLMQETCMEYQVEIQETKAKLAHLRAELEQAYEEREEMFSRYWQWHDAERGNQ